MTAVAAACVFSDGGDPNQVTFLENHDMSSSQNPGRVPHRVQPGAVDGQATW
jgi:hypothetical protein